MADVENNQVNPARYSEAENEFLLAHLGEPPLVAARSAGPHINFRAVEPLLRRVVELEELKSHRGEDWIGFDALRGAIGLYLTQLRKWRSNRGRRGAVAFPSLYTYTPKGRPIFGAAGADSGIVKSYFAEDGTRKSFVIDLVPDQEAEWNPDWALADETNGVGLTMNHDARRIECFCGHTEQFRAESRASLNAARARMSKHLRSATEDVDRHREVYALEFGS